jgi:putative transposase of IS4/5 family DUF4096
MGLVSSDDGWRMPEWLWERVVVLLPSPPAHPLGCHRPRVPDRAAMDAVLLVLGTGMQWNALNATGICGSSSIAFKKAHAARLAHALSGWALRTRPVMKGPTR